MSSEGVDNKEFGSILLRLILCLLAGGLGIHKFVEGKILMGFVYILTFGLCYIGVIVDIVTYVSKLVEINKEFKINQNILKYHFVKLNEKN